jgi:hypothetical protein
MWPPQQQQPTLTTPPSLPRRVRSPSTKAGKAISKAAADHSPARLETLNRFIAGRLMGLSMREAAMHAGVPAKTPRALAKAGWRMHTDPYVRKVYKEALEEMARDQLCTFSEQVLDLKQIAFDQSIGAQSRILAHGLIADLLGHKAAVRSKVEVQAEVKAGVMLVPLIGGMDAWEAIATQHQQQLREACKT